jgi:hypothetical protein
MRTIALIAGVLSAGLVAASPGAGQELRYWGKQAGTASGRIEMGHGAYYEIGPGTEIPGWGRVKEVSESHLVVERVLTESQKSQLREQGAMVYDVLHIHIPNEDLRRPPPASIPRPRH